MSFEIDYDEFFKVAVPGASNMFWFGGIGVGPFEDETLLGWITGEVSVEGLKEELDRYYGRIAQD